MLEVVKTALRITTSGIDYEIEAYIAAALTDLGIAGVVVPEEIDPIIKVAVITYVKMRLNYGEPEYAQLKNSYDEQKAQLSMATGYTQW